MMDPKTLFTRYSTWVVGVLMAGAAYWLSLPPAEQAALATAYPILSKLTPLAGFVAFLAARAKSQAPAEPKE